MGRSLVDKDHGRGSMAAHVKEREKPGNREIAEQGDLGNCLVLTGKKTEGGRLHRQKKRKREEKGMIHQTSLVGETHPPWTIQRMPDKGKSRESVVLYFICNTPPFGWEKIRSEKGEGKRVVRKILANTPPSTPKGKGGPL